MIKQNEQEKLLPIGNIPVLEGFTCDLLNEDRCREWFLLWLYQDGVYCPRCGFPLQKRRLPRFFTGDISYCSVCRKKFYPLRGSPFHWTKLTYAELILIMVFRELDVSIEVIAALLNRQPVAVKTAADKVEKIKVSHAGV